MTRFRWNTKQSETAVVHSTIIRINNRRVSLDQALTQTIANHSQNPEAIPQRVVNGLRKQVEKAIKENDKCASRQQRSG